MPRKHKHERKAFTIRKKKKEEVFDPAKLVERAARNLDPSVLDGFDESDVRKARNVYDWCTSRRFMFAGTAPFPMQMKVMLDLFEDYCPDCSDMVFWKGLQVDTPISEIGERMILFKHGKCKNCGKTRADFVGAGYYNYLQELAACCGMRSGKTAMAGMISSYQLHRFLTLKSPAQTYGLLPGSTLTMTFAALTAGQAEDTLWDSFNSSVSNSPWYTEYHKFLAEEGQKIGAPLYNFQATKLDYFHKGLAVGFTGADYRTIKGRTRFYSSIDELGFFDSQNNGKVKANAHEVFTAFEKSLRTVRSQAFKKRKHGHYDIPTGLMVNVSSPENIDDAIMQRVRKAEENKKIYAIHLATWEFNPDVTIESLKDEAENPATFDRDYGAIPPLASDPFITDKQQIDKVFSNEVTPLFQTGEKEKVITLYGMDEVYFWLEANFPFDELTVPRCVGVDTGESNNSFAITIAHFDNVDNKTVIDQLIELRPEKGRRVFFPGMLDDFFLKLMEHLWIKYFVFDQWNSVQFAQDLIARDVKADMYSISYDEMVDIRKAIMADTVLFPKTEHSLIQTKTSEIHDKFKEDPISHLKLQMATVRNLGRKVVKPANGTDDLFRSMCLACVYITLHKEDFSDYQAGVMPMYRTTGSRKHGGGLAFAMKKQGGMAAGTYRGGLNGGSRGPQKAVVRVQKGSGGMIGGNRPGSFGGGGRSFGGGMKGGLVSSGRR